MRFHPPAVRSTPRPVRLAATLVATVCVAAACGSSSSDSTSSSGSGGTGAGSAKAALAADYKGTYEAPPTVPTVPAAGKSVWIISCGQIALGCSVPSNAAAAAAKAAGWKATVYDGKLGVDNAYAAGVRQAIAAKADAIVIDSIDCAAIKQPLQEAKSADITVIGMTSYDCDDPRLGGGEPLFTASVISDKAHKTVSEYAKAAGAMKADWVLATAGDKAHALSLTHSDSVLGQDIAAGFDARIKECKTCKLTSVPFTFADVGSGGVATKVGQALLRDPSINAVTTPYDSLMVLGVAQAIVRSGRSDKIAAIGGEGYAPNLSLIKSDGGQDAAVYQDTAWTGWAAVDSLIRLFNDEPLQPAGIGFQLVDKDHMPKTDKNGSIVAPFDYKAAYLKAWGK